jgi:alpha-galactosidase
MAIFYDKASETFHLQTKTSSYVIRTFRGTLTHLYWGSRLERADFVNEPFLVDRAFSPSNDRKGSLDTLAQEYPTTGTGDFRTAAFQVQFENGSTVCSLKVGAHRQARGKIKIKELPSTYATNNEEVDSLEIDLVDELSGLLVTLQYAVFAKQDVIVRSAHFKNNGKSPVKILRALSASVDFPHSAMKMLTLTGAWARERDVVVRPLVQGTQGVESRRGFSSHQQSPFVALFENDASEEYGNVWSVNLVYSGNFLAQTEVDQMNASRLSIGVNPYDFSWHLASGETFQTPETVLLFSNEGLGGMTRRSHDFYRNHLCRGPWVSKNRPILINNWEATYFDFNSDKIVHLAKKAKELGLDLLVLDDGWFGKRDDDKTSLGDWFVDKKKIPEGIDGLAKRVNEAGVEFGLWFEPETISPDSELYRQHPDWAIHVPKRDRTLGRDECLLDITRPEVRDYVVNTMSELLTKANIKFIKWDMNRHMTEPGSSALTPERQRETAHRFMLGLYDMLERLTSAFPDVLWEGCSGGGGRFDAGLLPYFPQTWTSDDSDAAMRMKIQYGTSLVYPLSSMDNNVSVTPNHQMGRDTPFHTRANVGFFGSFGYQLDITKLSKEEEAQVREQVANYRRIEKIIREGKFYRLRNPFEGNSASWMSVSADKSEALIFYGWFLAEVNGPIHRLKLKALSPDKKYHIEVLNPNFHKPYLGVTDLSGEELMKVGMPMLNTWGDFGTGLYYLKT